MDNKTLTPKKFIFSYVIPMFAVALALVLLSYSSHHRIDTAQEQIDVLAAQLTQKQTELAAFEERYSNLSATFERLATSNAETLEAVDTKDAEIAELKAQLDELGAKLEAVSAELEETKAKLKWAKSKK